MNSNNDVLFFVFDVESVGLYGEGVAVGWTVVDINGQGYGSGLLATQPENVRWSTCEPGAREWVAKNIPALPYNLSSIEDLCASFWWVLQMHSPASTIDSYKDAPKVSGFWADWRSPVESSFLARVAEEGFWNSKVNDIVTPMPAPLHEIATLELAAGITEELPRLPSELPEHNPLNDARHSARKLVNAMRRLREMTH
jgi:hypothetical protein